VFPRRAAVDGYVMVWRLDRTQPGLPPFLDERSAGVQHVLSQFRPGPADGMPTHELRAEAIVAVAFVLGAVQLLSEADDHCTGSHSQDVLALVMAVGPRMRLDEDQLRRLEMAALLHDVGKIAVPKEIINKSGPLTPDERAVIEKHSVVGQRMLENVGGVLSEVGAIVRSCHERYDGLGYPDGLAGEEIPIEARIVSCCDAFNAMTTNRPYRAAVSRDEGLRRLHAHRGTQFDPDVVDCLAELLGGAAEERSSPALALEQQRDRPVVHELDGHQRAERAALGTE
jgi:HD-GYP domain-containing protein (c-di-GMP phosphodiesterase class II)